VFVRTPGVPGTWTQAARLLPSRPVFLGNFGYAAAIERNTLVVGAYRENYNNDLNGAVYVFSRAPGSSVWSEQARLAVCDADYLEFGTSVALSQGRVLAGGPQAPLGLAYLYDPPADTDCTVPSTTTSTTVHSSSSTATTTTLPGPGGGPLIVPMQGDFVRLRAGRGGGNGSLVLTARAGGLALPSLGALPTAHLVVAAGPENPSSARVVLDLPAPGWKALGGGKGLRYRGSTKIVLRRSGEVHVKVRAIDPSALLGSSTASLRVTLELGPRRLCALFGGKIRFVAGKSFSARRAPAPLDCL
jgi:hypothetical protein